MLATTILHRHVPTIWPQIGTISLQSAIHWILQHFKGVQHLLHYLDDFFTAGPAASPTRAHNLQVMFSLCEDIQALIKLSKVEGPTTSMTFLGIHLNSITMESSISADRKQALLEE